jgi:hypothetical protein
VWWMQSFGGDRNAMAICKALIARSRFMRLLTAQSRQNYLDQQHTPNIANRATNPSSAQRQKRAPYREAI